MSTDNQTPNGTNGGPSRGGTLGLAGNIARAFIHSPLTPLLFFAMLGMGILGLIMTPRQEDPQISVPMVDVFVKYPGASSEQVASLAIDPLQRLMSEIPGVKHVYSVAQHGQGMVTVRFKVGEKLGPSIVKVHDKIASNLDKIPPGVSPPLVKPKGINDVPVVTLTMWSKQVGDGALRTLGLDLLQNLKQIPNTGQGFVVGGRPEEVRVEVEPQRLAGYGISIGQVAQTIRTANSEERAGEMESGNHAFTVYTGAFLHSAADVARLVVAIHNGVPVYVRDVAKVFQAPAETQHMVEYYTGPSAPKGAEQANGVNAVTVAVAKKEGTNGVTVADAIIARVKDLKGRLIPDNVHVSVTRNYGKTANDKVNELIFKLFVATAAVAILVWLTLGIRPALVVLFVIPVVILITVFSAWVLGYSINRVSLFALIFSIGILVDDAIVVVENIYRRWLERGEMDTATAVDAVREVGNPTILATFTVISALLPMGFVRGMMGPYMEPIPALGSVAMLFSLMAAFIFTPWLAMRLRPSMAALRKAEKREERFNAKLAGFFRKVILPVATNRVIGWTTLGAIVAAFFLSCAMFYTTAVTVKMLPYDNKPEYSVFLNMPEGTALPVTANITRELTEKLRTIPEVTALQSYVGTSEPFDFNGMVRHYYLRNEPWQADIHIQLLPKNERKRSSHQIALATRALLEPLLKGTGGRLTVVEMPPGPPVLQSIVAEIYGPTAATRRAVARKMFRTFDKAKGVADVDTYMQRPYNVWRFEVNTEKAVRRGISVDEINRNLAMAMGGYKIGDVKQGTVLDPTYIVIQVPFATRSDIARLDDLPIRAADGTSVPLAELGRFYQVRQDPVIYQKDLRPVEYVMGDAVGRLAAPVYGMLEVQRLLENYKAPDGVKPKAYWIGPPPDNGKSAYKWSGEWTVTYETFRDMGMAFGVALILIYILVVWEFGNFLVPLVIMAPIPLTLIGIIPGHWLLHADFTATSMIGFIALAGIIVRNSILLVDFSRQKVEEGVELHDAVILACKTRTRPILITALALVAGSSVILFDPIFQGMAISLLFGVLVSTLLTLVVIPLGCITARSAFCPAVAGGGADGSCCGLDGGGDAVQPKPPVGPRVKAGLSLSAVVLAAVLFDFLKDIVGWIKVLVYGLRLLFRKLGGTPKGTPPSNGPASPPPSAPTPPAGTPPASDSIQSPAGDDAPDSPKASTAEEAGAAPSEGTEAGPQNSGGDTAASAAMDSSSATPPKATDADSQGRETAASEAPRSTNTEPSKRRTAKARPKVSPKAKTTTKAKAKPKTKAKPKGRASSAQPPVAGPSAHSRAKPKAKSGRRGIRLKPGLGADGADDQD